MAGFYHVCFVVPDMAAAIRDLGTAAGVEFSAPRADRIGEWDFRIAFTRGEPPYVELIEPAPGGPWDVSEGPRFDHLGFWTRSVEDGSRRLAAEGFPEEFSGCPYGRSFAYHRVDSIGARVELVDLARQPAFLAAWNPAGAPMPPVEPAPPEA
ncbi:VOC family protein [Streptomyces noursei]|uniref:VOC family protein n=1 Tax=Streptomyces noursei TaxID=1971 RepID=UPI0023B8449A|nr:VOC family protein [Streptomyces noursei]